MRVTVLDRHNYHAFLPLLYQVATAGLEPQDIAYPIRGILRSVPNAVYRMAEVVGGDPSAHYVETREGERLEYDFLVLAAGSRTDGFGLPGVETHAYPLHSVDEARAFRNHVLRVLEAADWTPDLEERRRRLTFVVVGAGPTGLETAGALGELRRHVVPRDYPGIDPEDLRIVLVEAGDTVMPALSPRLQARALRDVRALGVEVKLNSSVREVREDRIELADGTSIPTSTVLWAAGIRGALIGEKLGLPVTRSGRVRVGPTLQVPGHPDIYAIGDLASVDGDEMLPNLAPVAIQQGKLAGLNLGRALSDEPPGVFLYRDRGDLATIGRSRAVGRIFGVEVSGFVAWWVWLLLHLIQLMGFRNRGVVLVNWVYNYLTYDRGPRSIVGGQRRA